MPQYPFNWFILCNITVKNRLSISFVDFVAIMRFSDFSFPRLSSHVQNSTMFSPLFRGFALAHLPLSDGQKEARELGVFPIPDFSSCLETPKVMRPPQSNVARVGPDAEAASARGHRQRMPRPHSPERLRPQGPLTILGTWLPDGLRYAVVIRPMH